MKTPSYHQQRGLSIIELMVGMVLALITVMAMLSVYKSTAKTTAESKLGANIDGQIAVGLLTADRFLQGAGYGNASAWTISSTGVVSTLASGTNLQGVIWNYGDNTHCQALTASGANLLFYYGSSASGGYSCSSPPALPSSGSASQAVLISAPSPTIPSAPTAASTTIAVSQQNCTPFGITASGAMYASGSYTVTLNTTGYAGNQVVHSTTCLVNFH